MEYSVLMWSHYGNNHTGVCVGFDTAGHLCEQLGQVDYSLPRKIPFSVIEQWRIDGCAESEELVRKYYFYGKSDSWSYENEWRDLKRPSTSERSGVGVELSPFDISEIIFGLRCNSSVIAAAMKIHQGCNQNIDFYKIDTKGNSFDLKRERLNVDEYLSGSPGLSLKEIMEGFKPINFNDI